MGAPPEGQRRQVAVTSLYRIRAVEGAYDEEGLKSVWHQTAEGADLLSYVDRAGRVVRQELSLLEDFFLWTSQHGLRSGSTAAGVGIRTTTPGGQGYVLDPSLSVARVGRGADALASHRTEDKYIVHIGRILRLAKEGLQSFEADEVTSAETASSLEVKRARERAVAKELGGRRRRVVLIAGAIAVVALGAVAALLY